MFRVALVALGVSGGAGYCYYSRLAQRDAEEARRAKNPSQMSLRERFEMYATRQHKSGMSVDDFVASVTTKQDTTAAATDASGNRIRSLFAKLHSNNDDRELTYDEYCMFFSLISNSDDH